MMPGQERPDVNAGGKIIMPPSSLESLSRLNISFPMLFKVENKAKGRFIEFQASTGQKFVRSCTNFFLNLEPWGKPYPYTVTRHYILMHPPSSREKRLWRYLN